jgi:hypothetical protein
LARRESGVLISLPVLALLYLGELLAIEICQSRCAPYRDLLITNPRMSPRSVPCHGQHWL